MSWEYRVERVKLPPEYYDDYEYRIVEHYRDFDETARTHAVPVVGASKEELLWTLERMIEALEKPTLEFDDE